MIIGLTGPKCAGKGTIAQYMLEKHQAQSFTMSAVLNDIVQRIHLPNTRANLIAVATGLRSQFGEEVIARALRDDIAQSNQELVLIDGIRMQSEITLFSELPDFVLWYVDAPVEQRYERGLHRGEKAGESEMTFEQFVQEESAVTEQGIVSLKAQATHVIDNSGSLDQLHTAIDSLMK